MKEKKRFGDRYDAFLVRDADPMHKFFPFITGGRTKNEAMMQETLDMEPVLKYIEQKNSGNPDFKYTMFHVICAAIAKIMVLRPKLNRYYSGKRLYERFEITETFIVKKQFNDKSEEAIAIIKTDKEGASPIDQIHDKVAKFVTSVRKEGKTDESTDAIATLVKFPKCITSLISNTLIWLQNKGWYPQSLSEADPYFSSAFISNVGSIKMSASYHHISDWGTNSFFVLIGEMKKRPFFKDDGTYEMKNALDVAITVDERIADGYYYSRTVRLLKYLMSHPELLDRPMEEPIDESNY